MAARLGIELSSVTCRIIEIEDAAARADRPRTLVRTFTSIPRAELAPSHARLAPLSGRHASVVLWTAHSAYRQVSVRNGPYDRMHADALRGAAPTGMGQTPIASDIAPAAAFTPGAGRRMVLLASVPRTEIAEALQPLKDAGIVIDAVLTPAAALASLARLRNGLSPSTGLEAYWAIEETASTLALIRDGHLLTARTAPWGYLSELSSRFSVQPRAREEITMRLAEDIAACLASVEADPGRLTQVCVCGGLPDLRNMTLPLMEQLDVEVEPLDTLFGIDPSELPGPGGEFQDRAAAFRLAWAAAADDSPLLNFARERHRQRRKAIFRQVAVAAGVLVGLGLGWVLQRQWRPPVTPVKQVADVRESPHPAAVVLSPATTPAVPAPLPPPRAAFEPGTEVILPGRRAPAELNPVPTAETRALPAAPAPPRESVASPSSTAPSAVTSSLPPGPPLRRSVEPLPPLEPGHAETNVMASPPRANARVSPPDASPSKPVAPAPAASIRQASAEPQQTSGRPARVVPPPAPRVAPSLSVASQPAEVTTPGSTPLPFDAALGTILYGPERKLAIVDGRIVQAGDDVRGAIVVEITPTSVYLRDAQGRLRRLTAGGIGH